MVKLCLQIRQCTVDDFISKVEDAIKDNWSLKPGTSDVYYTDVTSIVQQVDSNVDKATIETKIPLDKTKCRVERTVYTYSGCPARSAEDIVNGWAKNITEAGVAEGEEWWRVACYYDPVDTNPRCYWFIFPITLRWTCKSGYVPVQPGAPTAGARIGTLSMPEEEYYKFLRYYKENEYKFRSRYTVQTVRAIRRALIDWF